ncbi:MAG: hypothetical protein PHF83_05710, partial [Candidatus Methanomethylophilus sp.]|nr:hypothetical protein [Methanomethylophilus sp.]
GYLVGYVIVGRTRYTMVMDINVVSKTMRMRPWVLYMHDDKLCIQEQTNRALLRRQVFGVRHIVVSVDNVSISADWFSDSKYPMFPAFEKNLLVLEDLVVDYSTVHVIWRINARQYVTRIRVAYGSMASKLELMRSANVLTDQQNTIVSLANEVNELQTALGPQLMEMAISIDKKAVSTSPENRMYSMIKKNKQKAEPVQEVNKDGPSEGAAQTE